MQSIGGAKSNISCGRRVTTPKKGFNCVHTSACSRDEAFVDLKNRFCCSRDIRHGKVNEGYQLNPTAFWNRSPRLPVNDRDVLPEMLLGRSLAKPSTSFFFSDIEIESYFKRSEEWARYSILESQAEDRNQTDTMELQDDDRVEPDTTESEALRGESDGESGDDETDYDAEDETDYKSNDEPISQDDEYDIPYKYSIDQVPEKLELQTILVGFEEEPFSDREATWAEPGFIDSYTKTLDFAEMQPPPDFESDGDINFQKSKGLPTFDETREKRMREISESIFIRE